MVAPKPTTALVRRASSESPPSPGMTENREDDILSCVLQANDVSTININTTGIIREPTPNVPNFY